MKKSLSIIILAVIFIFTIAGLSLASSLNSVILPENENIDEKIEQVSLGSSSDDTVLPEDITINENISQTSDELSVLIDDARFSQHGFVLKEIGDAVNIDRKTAINIANNCIAENEFSDATTVTAVLARFTDTETPILPESNIELVEYPVWIVTYHGIMVERRGTYGSGSIYADKNIVLDAQNGDLLEVFSYNIQ